MATTCAACNGRSNNACKKASAPPKTLCWCSLSDGALGGRSVDSWGRQLTIARQELRASIAAWNQNASQPRRKVAKMEGVAVLIGGVRRSSYRGGSSGGCHGAGQPALRECIGAGGESGDRGSEKHALPTRCQAMRGHHLRGLQRRKQQQQRMQKSFRTTKNANPKVSLFFPKK